MTKKDMNKHINHVANSYTAAGKPLKAAQIKRAKNAARAGKDWYDVLTLLLYPTLKTG